MNFTIIKKFIEKISGKLVATCHSTRQRRKHGALFVFADRIIQASKAEPKLTETSTIKTKRLHQHATFIGTGRTLPLEYERLNGKECGCILKDAELVYGGTAIFHNGYYLSDIWKDIGHPELEFLAMANKKSQSQPTSLERVSGLSLTLTAPWSKNYYHWICQQLPRVEIASKLVSIDSIDHFIISEPVRQFQVDSLGLLGIHSSKLIQAPRHQRLCCDSLLLTAIPCANKLLTPYAIEFLANMASSSSGRSNPSPFIFIIRRSPSKRNIVNEQEVLAVIEDLGGIVVDANEINFSTQLQLFSESRIISGVHGAGLTNAVFSKQGATLIDLLPRCYQNSYFSNLAKQCGHEYIDILGEEFGLLPGQKIIQDADMIVPVKKLRASLNHAIRIHRLH